MSKPVWQRTIVTNTGDIVAGAEITVIDENTGVYPAGIYSDRAGTVPIPEGTLFADSEGFVRFYADPGEYRVTAAGVPGSITWRYQALPGDAVFKTVGVLAGQLPTAELVILKSEVNPANIVQAGDDISRISGIGRKNLIINGCLRNWQRGVSQTTDGYGSVDRFTTVGVGTTHTVTQQSFAPGQTDVPDNPLFFYRNVAVSVAGAANYLRVEQRIEDVTILSGKTVALSFWAKADAAKDIAMDLRQFFGSGGSTEVTGIGAQKFSLTTAWQKFTAIIAIPSVSGKTISGGNDSTALAFWFDAGSDFDTRTDTLGQQSGTFDIAKMQLEIGPAATEFEQRLIGLEELLCYRYYWNSSTGKGASETLFYATATYALNQQRGIVKFPIPMRDEPAISYIVSSGVIDTVNVTENIAVRIHASSTSQFNNIRQLEADAEL
jgi:hypothetical protein